MLDRVPLYPGRVKLTPVAGQENTYDMTRADQATQQGTPLNKATFLKDDTAALFGLQNTAVPDDVFAILSKATLVGADGSLSTASGDEYSTPKIEFTSYLGNGTGGPSNPCSVVFSFKPTLVYLYAAKNQSSSIISPTFTATTTGVYMIDISEYTNQFSPSRGFMGSTATNILASYTLNYGKFDDSSNELSWYNNAAYVQSRPANQLNTSGTTFFVVAVKGG